jgi:hypothetical protein
MPTPPPPRVRPPARLAAAATLLAGLAHLVIAAPATAAADTPTGAAPASALSRIVGVVELYTSQGCSSCPPADALLESYAKRPDILALTLPVDYWDYLGWKDTFGNPKHTERQRLYARARGDGQIYTPQVVVNGLAHANGSAGRAIDAALMLTEGDIRANRVPLRLWTERDTIVIETGPALPTATVREAIVWLAVVQTSADVEIGRGENRGRRVTYTNVVRELTPVGTWNGQPMRITLTRSALMRKDLDRVAVIVQHGKAGPVVGAAITGLW